PPPLDSMRSAIIAFAYGRAGTERTPLSSRTIARRFLPRVQDRSSAHRDRRRRRRPADSRVVRLLPQRAQLSRRTPRSLLLRRRTNGSDDATLPGRFTSAIVALRPRTVPYRQRS